MNRLVLALPLLLSLLMQVLWGGGQAVYFPRHEPHGEFHGHNLGNNHSHLHEEHSSPRHHAPASRPDPCHEHDPAEPDHIHIDSADATTGLRRLTLDTAEAAPLFLTLFPARHHFAQATQEPPRPVDRRGTGPPSTLAALRTMRLLI
jgi:hypothetical protein